MLIHCIVTTLISNRRTKTWLIAIVRNGTTDAERTTTGGTIDMVFPWLLAGYALYKGYGIYNEGRALRDYKRRYPWVRIKYPSRTKVAKEFGGALGVAGMYHSGNMYRPRVGYRTSYDPVKYMYG